MPAGETQTASHRQGRRKSGPGCFDAAGRGGRGRTASPAGPAAEQPAGALLCASVRSALSAAQWWDFEAPPEARPLVAELVLHLHLETCTGAT